MKVLCANSVQTCLSLRFVSQHVLSLLSLSLLQNLHHMRRSQWYQIGKTIPRRSGVGPRQNIIGAIAFWREKNSAGQYELKHKVIQECLKVWDGRTTDASKPLRSRPHRAGV